VTVTCPLCQEKLEFYPETKPAERAAMASHLAIKHPGYHIPNRAERRARQKGGRRGR
jgi:hypothetical protein